jgi:hypothetical protein
VRGLSPFSRRITGLETRDAGILSDLSVKFNPNFFEGFPGAEALVAMLKGLLERDPEKRIASLEMIQGCDFFKCQGTMPSLDWERLKQGAIPAPFKPSANGAINAENAQDIAQATTLKTASFRKIDVSQDEFPDITSVSVLEHQKDIVEVLEMERRGELDVLLKSSSGCCVVQ